MFGRTVTFSVKNLGTFKVFVFCVPSTPPSELQKMARKKVAQSIINNDAHLGGNEIEFTPEA